jgi:acyl carrier protein
MKTTVQIRKWLVSYVAKLAAIEPEHIDTSLPFNSYGIDSTATAGLGGDLALWLGIGLADSVAFEHPTIDGLSSYAASQLKHVQPQP